MSNLNGRVAVVTGAGRGLGRAHALLLAASGARVVVNDMTSGGETPAEDVVAEIRAAGGDAVAHTGSVSDWKSAEEMIGLAVDTYGRLDVLVNNAGILRDRVLVNMSEDEWDAVIDVHLKGHFVPLHHAAAYWRAQSKGGMAVAASVINTSSGSGLKGNPGQLNYAAAKAGIAAMTQVAARELDRYGVRVNAIAPIARTRMTMTTPGIKERLETGDGFDRFAPENVSPLVVWLAGDECQVSGQVFTVVGGEVGWQSGWSEAERFSKDGPWTPEELQTALAHLPKGAQAFQSGLG